MPTVEKKDGEEVDKLDMFIVFPFQYLYDSVSSFTIQMNGCSTTTFYSINW